MKIQIKAGIVFLSFLLISSQFWGCDDGFTPVTVDVTGNVTDFWGEPIRNKLLLINTDSVYTDFNGNFAIEEVTPPYNILIHDTISNAYYCYQDGRESKITLKYSIFNGLNQLTTSEIKVTTQPGALGNGIQARFIFTDGELINGYGTVNDQIGTVINLHGNSSLQGKLILIAFKKDGNGHIVSYENFGQKDLTLTDGGDVTVNFDAADISFNPGEAQISGTFSSSNPGQVFYYLKLSPYYNAVFLAQTTYESNNNVNSFNFVVPSDLPIEYYPFIYFAEGGKNYSQIIPPGSSGLNFSFDQPPGLNTPQNGEGNVNIQTGFTTTSSASNGFYVYRIYTGNNEFFMFITQRNRVSLEDMSLLGAHFQSGVTYDWIVTKISGYRGIDDYLVNPNSSNYSRVESEFRSFTAE